MEEDESKISTLNWIYGIDSPGMQHKTGFTLSLLEDLLIETGFTDIVSDKQRTYKYEHGLRIKCRKNAEFAKTQLFALFRIKLKKNLALDDSYYLTPLEDLIRDTIESYKIEKVNEKEIINRIISKTVICNPIIPLTFIEVFFPENKSEKEMLFKFKEMKIHQKIFSVWIKNRKDNFKVDLQKFIQHLENLFYNLLKSPEDYEDRLKFILTKEPKEILLFDIDIILLKSKILLNQGIKKFFEHDFSNALSCLIMSKKINPNDFLVFWNIARLNCIINSSKNEIVENYKRALNLIDEEHVKKKIQVELTQVEQNKLDKVPREPISEDFN